MLPLYNYGGEYIKKQSTPTSFSSEEWINGNWKERYRMLEGIEVLLISFKNDVVV